MQAEYLATETAARVTRQGLWADNDPLPPWEYRKAER
jgi:endonuclease YncB( thermonuclease family)